MCRACFWMFVEGSSKVDSWLFGGLVQGYSKSIGNVCKLIEMVFWKVVRRLAEGVLHVCLKVCWLFVEC